MSNGLTDVVERISDASVSIEALGAQGTVRGSGLIIGSDGVVLTAAALVDGSTTLNVWLSNGTPEMATFVGSDAATGIAVLQLPKRGLPTISSVPPGRLVVHDIVALVTNTTTATNVSFSLVHALDASYESPSGQTLMDEIATDMVPGFNTLGSAVIDGRGNVIGVVVESEGTETLATPMWLALGVADEIAAKGVVVPGWLGINGVDDDASGIPDGVRVLGVTSRGAAQAAGVEPGDVIQAVDGASVPTVSALQAHLYCLEPGAMVRLTVLRGKQERTAEAVLALAPAA
jgi:S1-C subfamily serine protease